MGTVRSSSPCTSSSGTSSSRPTIAIGWVVRGSPPTRRSNRPNARSAMRRPNGRPSRLPTTTDSSGVTESATTATIRGLGASTDAAGAAGSASADASRPSPRTATAAIAVIPPMDEPTSATRRTPRSPRHASAPATSSTSSSPNVVGPSSEPPCPRKSRPSTPAVRRRNGPTSTRSGATEPLYPWSSRIASRGSGTQPPARSSAAPRRAARGPAPAGSSAGSHLPTSRRPSRDRRRTTSPPSRSSAVARPASPGRRRGACVMRRARRSSTRTHGAGREDRGRGEQQEPAHHRSAGLIVRAHPPPHVRADPLGEARELGRDQELRRRAGAQGLEGLEVLQRHRLLVDPLRGPVDPLQRHAEALGPQDRRLALALGLEDLGLLLALGHVDRRLPGALGLGDHRAPGPLGGQLPVHRVLDVARRGDLADLDRRDLAAPAFGDLVQLGPQDLVDLLALGQDVVEQDVADDRAQRGGGDALQRAREVGDVDDALERIGDPPVDQEVDVDRGVVLGDRRLARDLDELLAHVHLHRPVHDGDEEPEARVADHRLVRLAQAEDDHPLVLLHDPHRQVQDDEHHDGDEREGREGDCEFHVGLLG